MSKPPVRVRITTPSQGELDGIRLDQYKVGQTYEVSPSLATYLILTEAAEPVADLANSQAPGPRPRNRQ